MRKSFQELDFHLSTHIVDDGESDDDSTPKEDMEDNSDRVDGQKRPNTASPSLPQEPDLELELEQLPDEIQNSIDQHIDLFSDSGVTVIGLGNIDINEDAEFKDPEEHDDIGLDVEDVTIVEMFCEVGETRFVYSILPNQTYNGIEVQYNVLQELFLLSGVDALDDMDNTQRIQSINMLEEILSQKDLESVLRSNRTIDRSDLIAWINILRSQNADFIHILDYTPEGEVVGARLEKRIYLPNEDVEKEKRLHKAVQKITNISRSYSGLLGLTYLENGVRIPDSIGEKVRAAVSEEEWDAHDPQDEKERIRGFQ